MKLLKNILIAGTALLCAVSAAVNVQATTARDINTAYLDYLSKLSPMPEHDKMLKLCSDIIKLSADKYSFFATSVYDGGTVRGENGDPSQHYDYHNVSSLKSCPGLNEIFMVEAADSDHKILQQKRIYYNYYVMKYELTKTQTVSKDEINAFLKENFPKAECLSVTEYNYKEVLRVEGGKAIYGDKIIHTTPRMFIKYSDDITRSELLDTAIALKEKFGIHPKIDSTVDDVAYFTDIYHKTPTIDETRDFTINNNEYKAHVSELTPVKPDADKLIELIGRGAKKYGYDYESVIPKIYYDRHYMDKDYRYQNAYFDESYEVELQEPYDKKTVTFGSADIDLSELNIPEGVTITQKDIEDYLKANKFDTKVLSFKDGLIRLESFRNGEYTLTHSEALDMAYGLYKKYGIFPTANVYRLGRMYEETTGDYDGDGNVSIRDAAAIARAVASGTKLPKNSDFNNDGYTNIRDAAAMARFLAVTAKSSGSLETPEQIRTFLKHFIDSYAMDANIIVNSDNTKAIVGCKAEDKDSSDFIKMIMSVCRIDAQKVQFVNT